MATDPREVEAPERTHMTPGFADHFARKPRYGRMVEYVREDLHDALREKLEAAEAERDKMERSALHIADLYNARGDRLAATEAALTEARAAQAAAWEAGRDAVRGFLEDRGRHGFANLALLKLTPPADLSAALQRVRDEAWNEAIEEAEAAYPRGFAAIRALRRAPTEGEG